MPGAGRHRRTWPTATAVALRSLVVLGLAIDAVIHLRLAHGYQLAAPAGIGGGTLFRIQTALAIVAAVVVLLRGNRVVATAAFLVAAAGLGAVLLYRYVDVPSFGPFPSMYEPVWFTEKALSAVAETVAAIGALGLVAAPPAGAGQNRVPRSVRATVTTTTDH